MIPPLIICMGVSGVGKSTYAASIAEKFALEFIDADDLHSDANKQKMQKGIALSDSDRAPWMLAVTERLRACAAQNSGCVLAHSGLRQQHREQLRTCHLNAIFLHYNAARGVILERLKDRQNHFMPSALLDSQFASLQATANEADVIPIDASKSPQAVLLRSVDIVQQFITGE